MSEFNPSAIIYGGNNLASGAGVSSINDGTYTRLAVSSTPSAGMVPYQPAQGIGTAAKTLFSYLSTSGGGSANSNAVVNGSLTAQTFYFTPKVATILVNYIRLIMCTSSLPMTGAAFGSGAALSKGLAITCTSGGVTSSLFTATINDDWYSLNGGANVNDCGAQLVMAGDLLLNQTLVLNSTDQITMTVNDNLLGRSITNLRAAFGGVRP